MNPLAPLEELHGPSFSDQRSETRKPRVSAQVRRNINEYWKTKLETLENKIVPEHEIISDLLKGVNVYIQGYIEESDLHLKKLILRNGGKISHFLGFKKTTHIVCTNLCLSKREKMLNRVGRKVRVVHPSWIFDSLSQKKLQKEEPYELLESRVDSAVQVGRKRPSHSPSRSPSSKRTNQGSDLAVKVTLHPKRIGALDQTQQPLLDGQAQEIDLPRDTSSPSRTREILALDLTTDPKDRLRRIDLLWKSKNEALLGHFPLGQTLSIAQEKQTSKRQKRPSLT